MNNYFIEVKEISKILCMSEAYAYKVIRELNEELKEKGFRVVRGKVPRVYFKERYGIDENWFSWCFKVHRVDCSRIYLNVFEMGKWIKESKDEKMINQEYQDYLIFLESDDYKGWLYEENEESDD